MKSIKPGAAPEQVAGHGLLVRLSSDRIMKPALYKEAACAVWDAAQENVTALLRGIV